MLAPYFNTSLCRNFSIPFLRVSTDAPRQHRFTQLLGKQFQGGIKEEAVCHALSTWSVVLLLFKSCKYSFDPFFTMFKIVGRLL